MGFLSAVVDGDEPFRELEGNSARLELTRKVGSLSLCMCLLKVLYLNVLQGELAEVAASPGGEEYAPVVGLVLGLGAIFSH